VCVCLLTYVCAAAAGVVWGPRGVVGEIRERHLEALPAAHLYVGRTQLSLDAIRCYNAAQRMQYELHANDCRWVRVAGGVGWVQQFAGGACCQVWCTPLHCQECRVCPATSG
jgi:hypothetical protein